MQRLTITLVLCLSFLFTSCGQTPPKQVPNIVDNNGITTPLHQANIGKIVFTSGLTPNQDLKESDFLSDFKVTDESNLGIQFFMDNSLTNYLHQLDPTLTVEELLQKGNYQFSFYVDEDLLYTENLNFGAGLPRQKNELTTLTLPLISTKNEDLWSRFMWMRFYYRNGGYQALNDGSHELKIEIRPYLQQEKLIVGDLIAQGKIKLKWAALKEVSEEEIAIQPVQASRDWAVSNASYDQEKIKALNRKIAQNQFKDITSIVVIKEGKLLIEEYFNGADRSTLHDTRSVGKSFASTMTGIAIEEGHLKSIDQTLSEFYDLSKFANYDPKKEQVTLKSLLSMSSNFLGWDDDYSSPGNENNMYPTDDWVKFTLDLPIDDTKEMGEKMQYFTAGSMLMGDIINKSVPGGFEKYIDQKLFKPLDIAKYEWVYTPQNVPSTAGGLRLSSLSLAKYGQLYQNQGNWKGKQIISSDWVSKTMTNYFSDKPDQNAYGLLFWNHIYSSKDQFYEAFQCSGNGGNKVIIFNDQPIIIIITATAYNQLYAHPQAEQIVQNYILPALL